MLFFQSLFSSRFYRVELKLWVGKVLSQISDAPLGDVFRAAAQTADDEFYSLTVLKRLFLTQGGHDEYQYVPHGDAGSAFLGSNDFYGAPVNVAVITLEICQLSVKLRYQYC